MYLCAFPSVLGFFFNRTLLTVKKLKNCLFVLPVSKDLKIKSENDSFDYKIVFQQATGRSEFVVNIALPIIRLFFERPYCCCIIAFLIPFCRQSALCIKHLIWTGRVFIILCYLAQCYLLLLIFHFDLLLLLLFGC